MLKFVRAVLACVLAATPTIAQQALPTWAESAGSTYGITAGISYGTGSGQLLKLDVWRNQVGTAPRPTLVYIHGGGWVFGDKGGAPTAFLPFVEGGWNVVNVEYRFANVASAPAAVQDVRCALRWIYRNRTEYGFDTTQLVAMGDSAGGHLALMEGLVPSGNPLDSACPAEQDEPPLRVAAVVNWYGITDVLDLLQGPNRKIYAVAWLGAQLNRDEVAKIVSPLTYVRPGVPPVITIHGDADPTVPYSHAQRLDAALASAGVPHRLVTIAGGHHGGFTPEERHVAYTEIWKFLAANGLEASPSAVKIRQTVQE